MSVKEVAKRFSPWSAVKERLWPQYIETENAPQPCDPVTCSECPGGPLCCNHTQEDARSTDFDYSHNQMYRTRGHQRRYFLP